MRKQYGLKEIENPLFQSQQMYIGSQTTTLGALQLHDSQFDIRLEELTTSDTVQEFKAVIFKDSIVGNLGEFIELNIVTPYDQTRPFWDRKLVRPKPYQPHRVRRACPVCVAWKVHLTAP
ncbi:hypothetical protein EMCRGX_G016942 [Ephydatia muelleri]